MIAARDVSSNWKAVPWNRVFAGEIANLSLWRAPVNSSFGRRDPPRLQVSLCSVLPTVRVFSDT